MNILIPHSWLLEYLDTNATAQEIQSYVSLSGPSVERIHEIEGERVFDIEVTTNRVDSMSVRGIAREAAVILSQAGFKAKLKDTPHTHKMPLKKKSTGSKVTHVDMPKIKNDPELCKRILCIVVANVQKTASPTWMQKRLRQVGINPHDAVIDITNYITHELGHPCHAFDYDKVMAMGGLINVVTATKGKPFTTLDGISYTTVGGEVVFENDDGEIIDLPGIKGTANTSISDDTKNVLFWIESVDHERIRFASMTHAIRTVAAQLNEKQVDPELATDTMMRALPLFQELTKGTPLHSTFTDIYPGKKHLATVTLPLARVTDYLGIELEPKRIQTILETLGCTVRTKGKTVLVTPPSWRPDITIPADCIEEIARIYGYHNLPSVLMTGAIPTNRQPDTDFDREHDMKVFLSTLGGYEVYTYSLISEAQANKENSLHVSSETQLEHTHLKLKNPLTDDMVYLRRTLWISHLDVLRNHQQYKNLTLFELANIYIPSSDAEKGDSLPSEELHLTLTSRQPERVVKGMIEALCKHFYLPPLHYRVTENDHETMIMASDTQLGNMLVLPDETLGTLTIMNIRWNVLLSLARAYPVFHPIPKVAPIIEDMTFALPAKAHVGEVIQAIRELDPLIDRVTYKDTYKDRVTFTIHYQPEKEMNATALSPLRKRLVELLTKKFHAELVGTIA